MNADKPASAVALWLAAGMCLLPFLVPYHQLPLKSFHAEWLGAALGTCAAICAVASHRGHAPIPAENLCLGSLGLLLLCQMAWGNPAYPSLPLAGLLNVAYAALMIWLGQTLVIHHGADQVIRTLAGAILIGTLANAAAGIIQYYGRPDWLEDVVAALHHPRIYGNIGQTNLFANYLGVGQAALLLLWQLGTIRRTGLVAGTILLNTAGTLSGSRAWILYLGWLVATLLLAAWQRRGAERSSMLQGAAILVVIAGLLQLLLPGLNEMFALGPQGSSGLSRATSVDSLVRDSRWQAWHMAWRIFLDHPLSGAGLGHFAGAAFAAGMPPFMAYYGDVWTSPHNLVLHMLAETGLIGALAACGALGIWWWRILVAPADGTPYLTGFLIAAVGIQTIQSLLEYPFWNMHFLGLAALLMGAGIRSGPGRKASRWLAACLCVPLALGLCLGLRDYVRMDSVLITGTAQTLTPGPQRDLDRAVMHGVAQGLLGPVAELWITSGAPLERSQSPVQLPISDRVHRFWPSVTILARHVAWLSFADRQSEALALLDRIVDTYPFRCAEIAAVLARAAESDPRALAAASDRMSSHRARCQPNRIPD